jgi:hypothetical protein
MSPVLAFTAIVSHGGFCTAAGRPVLMLFDRGSPSVH